MNLKEYEQIKDYGYEQYCDYLVNKHGAATEPYFTDTYWTKTRNKPKQPVANKKATRTKEGLFMHHRQENHVASLSSPLVAANHDYELQSAENLVPCDYLEHLFLHILICENPAPFEGEHVGANGTLTWILPALVSFFEKKHIPLEWQIAAFERIEGDKEVYDTLIDRFIHSEKIQENCEVTEEELRNLVTDRLVFSHNDIVITQLNDFLSSDNKALVDLGTGLGKTTTALQYAIEHKCNCLVLCPSEIIKDGWKKSAMTLEQRVDRRLEVMSYQGFANQYESIDWSQYDLVICDEAHHCRGPVWGRGIRHIIDNKIVKVIGLTATPADVGDSIFGGNVCKGLTVTEGIEQGIIHPISYVGAYYNTDDILTEVKDFEDQELIGQLNLAINNTPTVKDIILSNMPTGSRKCIIFTQTIEAMDQAIEILRDVYPNGEYRKIHSKMDEEEVKANKEWFEETTEGFLCAVNMISEGAHYRGVNTVFMFRKTKSELLFNQQIGRIITLSKYENPNSILFDLVNNANSVEISQPLKISIGKRKKQLEQEKNFNESEQIIIKDYTTEIVEILKRINSKHYKGKIYKINPVDLEVVAEYNSLYEIKEAEHSNLLRACKGFTKTAGFYWCREKDYENFTPIFGKNNQIYCVETQEVFDSPRQLADRLNINIKYIQQCCNLNNDNYNQINGLHYCYLKDKDNFKIHQNKDERRVICINTKEEFPTLTSAAKAYGISVAAISRCCKKGYGTAGGMSWCYKEDFTDNLQVNTPRRHAKERFSPVYKYDAKTGDYIESYSTLADAQKQLGGRIHIENKTSLGYRWSRVKADNYFDIKN